MTESEFVELAAGHALGALTPEDEQAFTAALAAHPEWEAYLMIDAETAVLLADGVSEVAPPAQLRDALLAAIAETDAPVAVVTPTPAPVRHAPRTRRRGWFALAASLILLAGVAAGVTALVQQAARPAAVVALDRISSAPDARSAEASVSGGGTATLHWSASLDQAVLVSSELPELSPDHSFELWYVRDGTAQPAGTFTPNGRSATAVLQPGMQSGDVVAVTIERAGGSPSGKPTTTPIVAIPTS